MSIPWWTNPIIYSHERQPIPVGLKKRRQFSSLYFFYEFVFSEINLTSYVCICTWYFQQAYFETTDVLKISIPSSDNHILSQFSWQVFIPRKLSNEVHVRRFLEGIGCIASKMNVYNIALRKHFYIEPFIYEFVVKKGTFEDLHVYVLQGFTCLCWSYGYAYLLH